MAGALTRAGGVTLQTIVLTTRMKPRATTIQRVVALKEACAPGHNKPMMTLTGQEGRVKLHPLELDLPGITPMVPRQVGVQTNVQLLNRVLRLKQK